MPLTMAGATLASAGIGALSNLFDVASQADANRTNLKIARENRGWQSAENQKSRDFQQSLFNQTNAYNTPAATMQRYRDAGLNPFVADLDKVGSGATQPAAPTMQSAPNPAHMEPVFSGLSPNLITAPIDFALQKQSVNAQSANQTAQSFKELSEAAKGLYDVFGDKALDMLTPAFKQLAGVSFDGNNYARQQRFQLQIDEANADIKEVETTIAKTVGLSTAEEQLANLKADFTQKIAQVGLWSSLADLNRAREKTEGKLQQVYAAEVKEKLAHVIESIQHSKLYAALACTENEKRSLLIGLLRLAAGEKEMDYIEHLAEFTSEEDYRDWLTSDEGKAQKRNKGIFENDALTYRVNQFTGALGGIINNVPQLTPPKKIPRLSRHVRQNSMSPQGYKRVDDWFEYDY